MRTEPRWVKALGHDRARIKAPWVVKLAHLVVGLQPMVVGLWLLVGVSTSRGNVQDPVAADEGMTLPSVARVDAQPLLLLTKRLSEALETIGSPLNASATAEIATLAEEPDDAKVTATIQRLLDPLCVAAVEISPDGSVQVIAGQNVTVEENGWRAMLVKVLNHANVQTQLQTRSPNALPIPTGPQDEVENRWMSLNLHNERPLDTQLSGLELEYRILLISSVRVGTQLGKLAFSPSGENGTWANTNITVETVPATKVEFRVTDADGSACMGCFEIRDSLGRVYPAQPKRLAPDFFFQTQIYRETGEAIMLPRGTYTVVCSHGPESVPETKTIQVGEHPIVIDYQVERWIDTAKMGYWSGDHHIHAAGCLHYENPTQGVHPPDMLRHIMGEDVKVGCCLTWGPCFDYQKQFFTGRPDDVSRYPYLLRYDVEVSGFGSHESGHLNLLKLREQIPAGGDSKNHWPTLGLNTLKFAKRQGAVTGTAHSGNGLGQVVGRVAGVDGPHKLPCFDIPAFNGIGAHEFIMQVTHEVDGPDGQKVPAIDFIATMDTTREHEWNIWYHVLNCGIPVVASGETDFPCITGERVGLGRVYVSLPGVLNYDDWVEALRRGESYVSDGSAHLPNFQRNEDGTFSVDVAARKAGFPDIDVELIANGYPIEVQKVKANGTLQTLTFAAPKLEQSSWLAVRVFPSAHTNPIWVKINDKPVRVATSIEWCLSSLEQCWREKARTYAPAEMGDARAAYDHARKVYQGMLNETK
ncbi:MAG: CehA/McbA family metallohydrolase [Planctomycetaceae bacterium]|nr:CehA/McbA family metallohydrolase [Planctomycetaceae bacterium]